MTPAELLTLLQDFSRELLDLVQTRQTASRSVKGYDANNAYQQVLGRQDVHLRWLSDAIADLGGTLPVSASPEGVGRSSDQPQRSLIESDAARQRALIDSWTPRVGTITNARNRKMLELVLGEMKEHLRALQQAAEGRSDVLGRHADGKVLRGEVMAARPKN